MCADDYCEVYKDNRRRANKSYVCCAWGETIERRHQYVDIRSLYDGRWQTNKQCLRCNAMLNGIARVTGAPVDICLDCGADPFEPGEVPELEYLAFVTADEMQQ